MARTHLSELHISMPRNHAALVAHKAKLDEHDHAIDALEGGTTSSIVTIHPVRGASTTNIGNLAACSTTMDVLTLVAGDRVLLKDQSTVEENGIYVVGTVTGGATAPLTRATDWDEAAEIKPNTFVAVKEGTAGAGTIWQLTGDYPTVVGTSHQHFTQIRNATQADARLALTTTPGGASYVGVFDTAGYFTQTNVEAVLAELWGKIILKTTPGGASYVGVFDTANQITADNVEGALAEIVPKTIQKRTVTVNDEDAGMTGASYVVNIGAVLPANAVVLGHEINIIEQFAGEADTTIKIGGTDDDAIVASTDFDALAIGKYPGTLGAHPTGTFGGEQLIATFAATALEDLTAGQAIITVWFFVLA